MGPLLPLTKTPKRMVDSEGQLCDELVIIAACICDLPEQALNACIGQKDCVPCVAHAPQLGDAVPCAPWTGASILSHIHAL